MAVFPNRSVQDLGASTPIPEVSVIGHSAEVFWTSQEGKAENHVTIDSILCTDRGKLDPLATQAHGFVEGQTYNTAKATKNLEGDALMSKTKHESKQDEEKRKAERVRARALEIVKKLDLGYRQYRKEIKVQFRYKIGRFRV